MIHLDISMCRDLTDHGVICIAETCPALLSLNLKGLSRVSDLGACSICTNCWYLTHLDLEDVFLLRDDCFWFSSVHDGRKAANDNMLTSLASLCLTDCSNLTDRGIEGLAERCRKLDVLVLRGCDKITDTALRYMSNPTQSTASSVPMCDSIHRLNLSYATGKHHTNTYARTHTHTHTHTHTNTHTYTRIHTTHTHTYTHIHTTHTHTYTHTHTQHTLTHTLTHTHTHTHTQV
jgi:hypothetical protein